MNLLKNKIVLITGASSGIGKACAEHFAASGAKLILTARRIERLEKIASELSEKHQLAVYPMKLDVSNRTDAENIINQLPAEWREIDILINNAGCALTSDKIQDAQLDNWEVMIDTNLKGLLYVTHEILPTLLKNNRGHIINIGSIAGREYYPGGNIYCATKHAVNAISHSLRLDLLGSNIRVSEIAPGLVNTEFSTVRWNDKQKADEFYQDLTPLSADDIARTVHFCANQPEHVNISEMVVFPTAQASANHVSRK